MKNYQLFGNIGSLTILHYYPKLNENTFESIQVRLIQYILGIKMANCKKLKKSESSFPFPRYMLFAVSPLALLIEHSRSDSARNLSLRFKSPQMLLSQVPSFGLDRPWKPIQYTMRISVCREIDHGQQREIVPSESILDQPLLANPATDHRYI